MSEVLSLEDMARQVKLLSPSERDDFIKKIYGLGWRYVFNLSRKKQKNVWSEYVFQKYRIS